MNFIAWNHFFLFLEEQVRRPRSSQDSKVKRAVAFMSKWFLFPLDVMDDDDKGDDGKIKLSSPTFKILVKMVFSLAVALSGFIMLFVLGRLAAGEEFDAG